MAILFKCDRCGAILPKNAHQYSIEYIKRHDVNSRRYFNDICENCLVELKKFLNVDPDEREQFPTTR